MGSGGRPSATRSVGPRPQQRTLKQYIEGQSHSERSATHADTPDGIKIPIKPVRSSADEGCPVSLDGLCWMRVVGDTGVRPRPIQGSAYHPQSFFPTAAPAVNARSARMRKVFRDEAQRRLQCWCGSRFLFDRFRAEGAAALCAGLFSAHAAAPR